MPNHDGFPTVRERELEIEIEALTRENHSLRRKVAPHRIDANAGAVETKVQTFRQELKRLAMVSVDGDPERFRIIGTCEIGKDAFSLSEYVSKFQLADSDPREALAYLYRETFDRIARAYGVKNLLEK